MLIICQIDWCEVGVAFELQCLRNCTLSSFFLFLYVLMYDLILDEVGLRRRRLSIAPVVAAVQSVLEHVAGGSSDDILWQLVPATDNTLAEKCRPGYSPVSHHRNLVLMSSQVIRTGAEVKELLFVNLFSVSHYLKHFDEISS